MSILQTRPSSDTALRDEIAVLRNSLLTSKKTAPFHASTTANSFSTPLQRHSPCNSLNVTTWNCRGLSSAVTYLQTLADTSDIITISEHWLWPFELHILDSILPGYSSHGCSDKRLSDSSSISRGCGGVAILWKSSLSVTPISALHSDRCIAVQVHLANCSLSIISVYRSTPAYIQGVSPRIGKCNFGPAIWWPCISDRWFQCPSG